MGHRQLPKSPTGGMAPFTAVKNDGVWPSGGAMEGLASWLDVKDRGATINQRTIPTSPVYIPWSQQSERKGSLWASKYS